MPLLSQILLEKVRLPQEGTQAGVALALLNSFLIFLFSYVQPLSFGLVVLIRLPAAP